MVTRILLWLLAVVVAGGVGTIVLVGASVAGAAPNSSSGADASASSGSGKSPTAAKSGTAQDGANGTSTSTRQVTGSSSATTVDTNSSGTSTADDAADAVGVSAASSHPNDPSTPPSTKDPTGPPTWGKHVAAGLQTRRMANRSVTSPSVDPEGENTRVTAVAAINKPVASSQQTPPNAVKPALTAADSTESVRNSALTTAAATRPAAAVTPVAAAESTAATTADVSAPKPATVIDLVGTLVFDVLNAGMSLFAGAPVLPAGSTATVRVSTLQLPCTSSACTVTADWYFPDDPNPKGLIYFQHGILADAPMYSYTAATLAEETDSIVVAPTITSNFFATDGYWLGGAPMQQAVANLFVGDRAALTASVSAAAGYQVTLPQRVVLVGHSLGGSLVAAAAGDMVANGAINHLAGVVLLDGVSLEPTLISTTVAEVPSSLPILLIASPPYWLNQLGNVAKELVAARPGQFDGVELVGGSHIDAMQGGNPLVQFGAYVVGGFSQPQNIDAYTRLEEGWINDMFDGTHTGIYGIPGQTIQITTTAGTATAISLPAPPTQASPLDVFINALLEFASAAFFNLEPTSGTALL
jgi:hypothetical protein